jgi:hypothetical protein
MLWLPAGMFVTLFWGVVAFTDVSRALAQGAVLPWCALFGMVCAWGLTLALARLSSAAVT